MIKEYKNMFLLSCYTLNFYYDFILVHFKCLFTNAEVLGALLWLKFSLYNIIHIDTAGKLPKPNRVELSNMNTDLYPVSIKKPAIIQTVYNSFYPHSAFVDTQVLVAHY